MITDNIIRLYLTMYKGCEIIVENHNMRIHDNKVGNDHYIHSFRADEWIRAFNSIGTIRRACL